MRAAASTDHETFYHASLTLEDMHASEPIRLVVPREALKAIKAHATVAFDYGSIIAGGIRYAAPVSPSEFPKFPSMPLDAPRMIVHRRYFEDLAACAMSASEHETRPILLAVSHAGNTLVSTDSYRLLRCEQSDPFPASANVPAAIAPLLAKTFDTAIVRFTDAHAEYTDGATTITTRLIAGNYPDTSRIMPTQHKTSLTLPDVAPWIAALDACIRVHPKKGGDTTLDIRDGSVAISATNHDTGASYSDVYTTDNGTGDELHITCDARFLRDALAQIGDGAEIRFNGAAQPITIAAGRRMALVSPIGMR